MGNFKIQGARCEDGFKLRVASKEKNTKKDARLLNLPIDQLNQSLVNSE